MIMEVNYDQIDENTLLIKFEGKLNIENYLEPFKKVEQVAEDGLKNIIFDIENMSFMDSSGLRVFIQAKKKLGQNEGKVLICKMRDNIKKIFDLTDTLSLFELHSSVDAAKKSLAS